MAESRLPIFLASLAILIVLPTSIINGSSSHNQTILTPQVAGAPQAPVTGTQSTIILLVQFSDKTNSTSPSHITTLLSGLNNYYTEDSYGLVSFTATINPKATSWYMMPHPVESYSQNSPSVDTQLVNDALQTAYNAGINLHNYRDAIVVHAGADEAMTHASTDIHSFTIPGYTFNPTPLDSIHISTSVVSESDPLGVFCHEAGHLLGLPDLYDLTQQIDPVNNFVGYWDIMALGEWNPNNNNSSQPPPGSYPAQHSAWSKIKLGWLSNSSILTAYPGSSATVALHDLELPTTGIQAIKVPISVNQDGSLSYYLVEMRARIGQYDPYLPFPSTYPGAAVMIYFVNDSIAGGHGNLVMVNAHPGQDLSEAGFGPCTSPCISNNTYSDPTHFVKLIVTNTNSSAYTVVIDRTSSPLLLLQVNTPAPGMTVTIDGAGSLSDQSDELRLPVHQGPHEISIQAEVPVSLGSSSVQVGLSDTFAAWSDGNTANPRWVNVANDTILTATYRVVVESSFATAATAVIILGVVAAGILVNKHRSRLAALLPGNNSLGSDTVEGDKEPEPT